MVQLGVAVKNSMSTDLLTVTTRTAQGKKKEKKGGILGRSETSLQRSREATKGKKSKVR